MPIFMRRRNGLARQVRRNADAARDRKDWPAASMLYELYLSDERHRRDSPIWVQLGHARKEAGDFAGALDAYTKGCEHAPGSADAHLQLGMLQSMMGDDAAAANLQRALQLDPGQQHAHLELQSLQPDADGPATDARSTDLLRRADQARDRRAWANAASLYTEYLAAKPEDARDWPLWMQLGHARKESGALDGATQAYEQALQLAPDEPEAYLHLAHLRKEMGDSAAAFDGLSAYLELAPDDTGARAELDRLEATVDRSAIRRTVLRRAGAGGTGWIRYALPPPPELDEVSFTQPFPSVFLGLSRGFAAPAPAPADPQARAGA